MITKINPDNHITAGKLLESLNLLISKIIKAIILGEIKARKSVTAER